MITFLICLCVFVAAFFCALAVIAWAIQNEIECGRLYAIHFSIKKERWHTFGDKDEVEERASRHFFHPKKII